jgi:hypothetical protein
MTARLPAKPIPAGPLLEEAVTKIIRRCCVDWTGPRLRGTPCVTYSGPLLRGYGTCAIKRDVFLNHRLVLRFFRGNGLPKTKVVDHLCQNRACCNPLHLKLVSNAANARRNRWALRTECAQGHDLTNAPLEILTYTRVNKQGRVRHGTMRRRICRICRRLSSKRHAEKLRRFAA